MSKVEVAADHGDLVGEGPVWDEATGTLYWTDWAGRRFYRYHWASRQSEIVKQGVEVTGFALNRRGGFVVCNREGIWLWDSADALTPIAREIGGLRCVMNDTIADPAGRLFAGTCYYNPDRDYPLGHLIRVEIDGTAELVDEGIHLANGLGLSPDRRTLYFTDSAARVIYAYDYIERTGDVRNRRIAVKVGKDEGVPDGMTVDAEGFIWSAQWYGSRVVRYDPDGKPQRSIAVPAKQISSVAFGGDDFTHLFVTSAGQSFRSALMPPGYDPDSGYMGGRLFHIDVGIRGKAEFKADITLPTVRTRS